jgi:hypothetical protein
VARTILLFHIISVRPSKQSRMVGSTLGVYIFGLIFVSARTNKRHHHHLTYFVICPSSGLGTTQNLPMTPVTLLLQAPLALSCFNDNWILFVELQMAKP